MAPFNPSLPPVFDVYPEEDTPLWDLETLPCHEEGLSLWDPKPLSFHETYGSPLTYADPKLAETHPLGEAEPIPCQEEYNPPLIPLLPHDHFNPDFHLKQEEVKVRESYTITKVPGNKLKFIIKRKRPECAFKGTIKDVLGNGCGLCESPRCIWNYCLSSPSSDVEENKKGCPWVGLNPYAKKRKTDPESSTFSSTGSNEFLGEMEAYDTANSAMAHEARREFTSENRKPSTLLELRTIPFKGGGDETNEIDPKPTSRVGNAEAEFMAGSTQLIWEKMEAEQAQLMEDFVDFIMELDTDPETS